ncbi:hypothetical protein BJX70DRAFT_376054 [Aspergillus crustosus]
MGVVVFFLPSFNSRALIVFSSGEVWEHTEIRREIPSLPHSINACGFLVRRAEMQVSFSWKCGGCYLFKPLKNLLTGPLYCRGFEDVSHSSTLNTAV